MGPKPARGGKAAPSLAEDFDEKRAPDFKTLGSFPLQLWICSPDKGLWLAQGHMANQETWPGAGSDLCALSKGVGGCNRPQLHGASPPLGWGTSSAAWSQARPSLPVAFSHDLPIHPPKP